MRQEAPPAVAMRGIVKRYGAVLALDHVDFDVRAGEIHALLGENGAGKSTLMHILRGLTRADAGTIHRDGARVRLHSSRDATLNGIEMVHQHFKLVDSLSIDENLRLSLSQITNKQPPVRLAARALEIGARLGWDLDPNARVWQLAVGARQRLEILKALAADPAVLIFDEPTAVLTPEEATELFQVLDGLRDEGRAIVFISHKLDEIMALCDRVTVLRNGTSHGTLVVGQTSPGELAARMLGESSTFGSPPAVENRGRGGEVRLRAEEISVRDDRGVRLIRELSLSARAGEILGIAGIDGNGQSELAEALVGLRQIESGLIALDGRPPRIRAGSLGYVPPDRRRAGVVPELSVRDNLALTLSQCHHFRHGIWLRPAELDSSAAALIDEFDIRAHSVRQRADTLSGGNQQKVILARALYGDAPAVVAVNPTRGLDVAAAAFVRGRIEAARNRGCAVILFSTDLDEVQALADRLEVMHRGCLLQCASPAISRRDLGLMMGGRVPESLAHSRAGDD